MRALITRKIMRSAILGNDLKAMLHDAIFLATCNATMTNKKTFQVAKGVSHACNFFRNLQRVR